MPPRDPHACRHFFSQENPASYVRRNALRDSSDGFAELARWFSAADPRLVPVGASGANVVAPGAGALFEQVLMHTAFDLAKRLTRVTKLKDLGLPASYLTEEDRSGLVSRARRLHP